MANEITLTTGLRVVNGNLKVNVSTEAIQIDQTTARGGGPGTVNVGTTEETIAFGDITPGYVIIKNLDSTNFVDFGNATGNLQFSIPAGGVALFHIRTGTLYMKADTAACNCQIIAIDD
jgi:hypothetical protein